MQQSEIHCQHPGQRQSPPTLLDYLLVIARHKKMIFISTSVVVVITAIVTLLMPSIYTARAMIIPSDDDKGAMGAFMAQLGGLAGLASGAVGAKSTADLYVTMLKSETLRDPIIDRFKLMDLYDAKYRADVYKSLDANVIITLGKKDGVITIAVNDKDPKRGADMANAYVAELGKLASGLNMTGAGNNRLFLEKRIAEARANMATAEDALKTFQSKNKAISVTDQAKATIEGIAQLRAQLAVQEVQLGTLRKQFTDNSKEVKTAMATVANLRSQIAIMEGKGGGGSSSIPNVGNVPQLGQEYLRLMRDFRIQEAVLEMLTKQYEVSQLNEVKDIAPFQILQKAKVPERRSKPKRRNIVLVAALLGSLMSTVIAFSIEAFRGMSAEEKCKWKSVVKGGVNA